MTTTGHQRLAGEFAQAVATADVPALHRICTDDVHWTIPGTSPVAGRNEGVRGILAVERLFSARGFVVAGPPTLLNGPDSLIVHMHETGRLDGAVDVDVALLVNTRDGRISSITSHVSDIDAFDTYLGVDPS